MRKFAENKRQNLARVNIFMYSKLVLRVHCAWERPESFSFCTKFGNFPRV